MSNNKQSSIDYLISQITEDQIVRAKSIYQWREIFKQAKAMHREEHGKTWDDSLDNLKARGMNEMRAYTDFDDYYNEKFKGGNK